MTEQPSPQEEFNRRMAEEAQRLAECVALAVLCPAAGIRVSPAAVQPEARGPLYTPPAPPPSTYGLPFLSLDRKRDHIHS
jgi:hypothetical protein